MHVDKVKLYVTLDAEDIESDSPLSITMEITKSVSSHDKSAISDDKYDDTYDEIYDDIDANGIAPNPAKRDNMLKSATDDSDVNGIMHNSTKRDNVPKSAKRSNVTKSTTGDDTYSDNNALKPLMSSSTAKRMDSELSEIKSEEYVATLTTDNDLFRENRPRRAQRKPRWMTSGNYEY